MTYYTHRYTTPTEYQVVAHYDSGLSRVVDPHNEVDWIAAGNTPEKTSGDRFILIVDGEPVLDPNKDSILAAEAAVVQAEADRIAAKAQAELDAKIAAIADAKAAIASLVPAVDKATDIEGLKKVVLDLIKNVQAITE